MPDVGTNQAEITQRFVVIHLVQYNTAVYRSTLQYYHVTYDQSCLPVRSEDSVLD